MTILKEQTPSTHFRSPAVRDNNFQSEMDKPDNMLSSSEGLEASQHGARNGRDILGDILPSSGTVNSLKIPLLPRLIKFDISETGKSTEGN